MQSQWHYSGPISSPAPTTPGLRIPLLSELPVYEGDIETLDGNYE